MSAMTETTEGSGEMDLRTWLQENKLTSLLKNQRFMEYIDEQEASLNDILALNENELKGFIEECSLRVLEKKRFLLSLAKYRKNDKNEKNPWPANAAQPIIIIRGEAEQIAIDEVEKEEKTLQNYIENINESIVKTRQNAKHCEHLIDEEFNKMTDIMKQRRIALKKQLKDIENRKLSLYKNNLDKIVAVNNNIKRLQSAWNKMLFDTNIQQKVRRNKIKLEAENILKKSKNTLKHEVVGAVDETFNVKFNSTENYKFIADIGKVDGNEVVPQLSVVKVYQNNVDINIEIKVDDDILLYGLQCKELVDHTHAVADEKKDEDLSRYLEFKESKYTIKNLKYTTDYSLRAKTKISPNVWTNYSQIKYFKTKKKHWNLDCVILTDPKESVIFENLLKPQLQSVLNKEEVSLKLIYRSSRDGKTPSSFHAKCDGHCNTITLIHSNYDHIFGGFTTHKWTSKSSYVTDNNSFLFLIRSAFGHQPAIYKAVTNNGRHVYDYATYGPTFGSGHNIVLWEVGGRHYTRSKYSFEGISGNALGGGQQHLHNNSCHVFTLNDCEVFVVT